MDDPLRRQIDEGTYSELLWELSDPDFLQEIDDTVDTIRYVADKMSEDGARNASDVMRAWAMALVVARQKMTPINDRPFEPI